MSVGDGLFYMPTSSVYGRPEAHGLAFENVYFKSTGGTRLHGWFLPSEGVARGTIVHFHGNAGNITGHFEHVKWLPSAGWNVLCFDYRGYGQSTGKPTRRGTVDDGLAAVEYAASRDDVDALKIVGLGQSLGGAVGIVVAAKQTILQGFAAEGAFCHYRTEAAFVCRQNLFAKPFAGWLTRRVISVDLEPIDWVARIAPRPVMFVCGTSDRIVDYRQSLALHEAAGEPKSLHVIEGGGHVDAMCTPERRAWFTDFLDAAICRQRDSQ